MKHNAPQQPMQPYGNPQGQMHVNHPPPHYDPSQIHHHASHPPLDMLAAPPEVDMTQNFYKLPAGLMVGILSDPKSKKRAIYQPIDPNDLKIPPSIAPNPEITDLLTEYYANIFDSKSKNRYGYLNHFSSSAKFFY